ncbi:hypothetical protein [Vibrio sp. F74]
MSDTVTSVDRKISLATECVSLHNIKRVFAPKSVREKFLYERDGERLPY